MNADEFIDEFIQEANEHLTVLSDALLELENNPQDTDAINRIFRAAHTLKGNSATMGFMDISKLAHRMENVLDGIRDGELEAADNVVDVLFGAVDALEAMVESVSSDEPPKECSKIISGLDSIISTKKNITEQNSRETKTTRRMSGTGSIIFRVCITLSKNTVLKSVRAFMVLKNLESIGDIVRSDPDINSIEEGEFEDGFTLYLNTDSPSEDVESMIKTVGDVEGFDVEEEKSDDECKPETIPIKEIKSVRVGTDKLDALVNLVGELVINKSWISQLASDIDQKPLNKASKTLKRLSRDLQDISMSIRMIKVAHVFDKFPRMMRDIAKKEGKEIDFILEGKDIELDRTILERLGDPLVHLLRNSVDHGIESPEEREKAGKPRKGTIKLSASRVKDHVKIVIDDDGKGIDSEALRTAAIEKGILNSEEAEDIGEDELIGLIFKPGFSSAKKVTDISGRGVGMDVVKTTVSKLGGSVQVSTTHGKGSVFTLTLPLSLAIIKALLVKLSNDVYAVPTRDIIKVLDLEKFKLKTIKGKKAVIYRDKPLPVLRLGEMLNSHNGSTKDSVLIIVEKSGKKIGLSVERILRQEEIVIKPLGEELSDTPGISGATILGDGKVGLIIDIHNLI